MKTNVIKIKLRLNLKANLYNDNTKYKMMNSHVSAAWDNDCILVQRVVIHAFDVSLISICIYTV